MRRTLGYAVAVVVSVAVAFGVGHQERVSYQSGLCEFNRVTRAQGNERAEALLLLRETTLNAHEQAIKKGVITEPPQDPRLRELDIHKLPPIFCNGTTPPKYGAR